MAAAQRPLDSGRRDSLGRTIRVAGDAGAARADAPAPGSERDVVLLLGVTNPSDDDWSIDELGRTEGLTSRVLRAEMWSDEQVDSLIGELESSDAVQTRGVRDAIRDAKDSRTIGLREGTMLFLAQAQVSAGTRSRDSLARFRHRVNHQYEASQWDQMDGAALTKTLQMAVDEMADKGIEPLDRSEPFPPPTTVPGQGLKLRLANLEAYMEDRFGFLPSVSPSVER